MIVGSLLFMPLTCGGMERFMEYLSKAALEEKVWRSYLVKITAVGTISLTGLILAIISIFSGNYLFAFWYFVAFCLGFSYVIMRINTAFPTYLATDGEKLVLSTWNNGVFPYRVSEKANFISDFIPESVRTDEIAFGEIEKIFLGSKRYMQKILSEEEYPEVLKILEKDKNNDKILKRMDFLLVTARNGESSFMSITDFDIKSVSDVIDVLERNCPGVKFQIHMPKLVRLRNRN